ncbi:MAG: type II secretion system F family protein, partial [Planctomycetales bacterium]|nr:type II secretion system F family protein [Planctomycetales bacterium]
MPEFNYIARNASGQKVTGTLAAASQREAIAQLGALALFPLNVAAEKPKSTVGFGRRVSGQLVATAYGQLAALLRSGVPLLRSLAVLREQTSHRALKEVLSDVHARVEQGESLGDA